MQVQQEIERFKSQNIEMEEKRKAILKELEVIVYEICHYVGL